MLSKSGLGSPSSLAVTLTPFHGVASCFGLVNDHDSPSSIPGLTFAEAERHCFSLEGIASYYDELTDL